MKLYNTVVINDTGGLTRGLERGMNVRVTDSVLPNPETHLNYEHWFPSAEIHEERCSIMDTEILGYMYNGYKEVKNDLEEVLEEDRPDMMILGKLHNPLEEKQERKLVETLERNMGYMIMGVKYNKNDTYNYGENTFRVCTYSYGMPVADDEYYMVCFDKDKYQEYSLRIRGAQPHTHPIRKHRMYSVDDVIDTRNADPSLYMTQLKLARLNHFKDDVIYVVNGQEGIPAIRIPKEDDDYAVVVKANPEIFNLLRSLHVNKKYYRYLSSDECAWFKGFKKYAWVVTDKRGEHDLFSWHKDSNREQQLQNIAHSPSILTTEHLAKNLTRILGDMKL